MGISGSDRCSASPSSGPESGGLDRAERYVEQRRDARDNAQEPGDERQAEANPARVIAEIEGRSIRAR